MRKRYQHFVRSDMQFRGMRKVDEKRHGGFTQKAEIYVFQTPILYSFSQTFLCFWQELVSELSGSFVWYYISCIYSCYSALCTPTVSTGSNAWLFNQWVI